ncbi:MAG: dicarboxylate/amino acid:cation symporter [Deltaproteobacteria bacterium]|nr:dicarboxylate/amino acid:cation symporter [Deltaproteobacteria bacterium]
MKLHTQILLGMLAGAALGLAFGPNAALLPHDVYSLSAASQADLRAAPDDGAARLSLGGAPLELRILEERQGELRDALGAPHRVTTWARVALTLTPQHLLGDEGARLRAALDPQGAAALRPGARVEAWLRVPYTSVEGGGLTPQRLPVSGLGVTLLALLAPLGELFMRLLKMVITPLVFSSLLVGVASLGDVRTLGRLGSRTLGLYLATTAVAVALGLVCAHALSPGDFVDPAARARLLAEYQGLAAARATSAAAAPSMLDSLLQIIPTNPFEALARGDMLQVIFFATCLGVALTLTPKGDDGRPKGATLLRALDELQEAMIVMINAIMRLAPLGVAALVASVLGQSGLSVLQALVVYTLTVLLGLALHTALVYGGLVRLLAHRPLAPFARHVRPALLLAFSTSSSSATLPVTLECAEQALKVRKEVASFVLPLGSTVNMDGTALYQGVAAVFIAQVFGLELTLGDQLSIILTATLASVGAAGVPGAGLVTLALVLSATGIPQVGLALILGVDRLLDMFRTAVNVAGDLAVSVVMERLEGAPTRDPD